MFGTKIVHEIMDLRRRHSALVSPAFFLAGFFFDVFTLERIDAPLALIQQGVYLTIICAALVMEALVSRGVWTVSEKMEKWWAWHEEASHFFLGSLLSVYMLFFVLSSSLIASFSFIAVITVLMVINEMEAFKKQGTVLRWALLTLCGISFSNILIPIWMGSVGVWVFILATGAWALLMALLVLSLYRICGRDKRVAQQLSWPMGTVILIFIALYIGKVIPPIPLSLQQLGIYHNVTKDEGVYRVSYLRQWYQFWKEDSSDFVLRPDDRVFVFMRVFSPSEFRDQIVVRWRQKLRGEWQDSDRIPLKVTGGRDQGYRSFSYKSQVSPGDWRVVIESSDGRELGRKTFSIRNDETPQEPRSFRNAEL